jgi:hypothetical protein
MTGIKCKGVIPYEWDGGGCWGEMWSVFRQLLARYVVLCQSCLFVCFELIQKPIDQFSSNNIFREEKTSGCVLCLFHHGVTAESAGTIKPHRLYRGYLINIFQNTRNRKV